MDIEGFGLVPIYTELVLWRLVELVLTMGQTNDSSTSDEASLAQVK